MDTTGQQHTSANVRMWTEQAMKTAKDELGVVVVAVVGDNAANMAASREGLEVLSYGCQAHLVQLLFKDLFKDKQRDQILQNTVNVLKAVKYHHAMSADLKRLGCCRPVLPCDTRWGSVAQSFTFYNLNWPFIAQACATSLKPGDPVRRTVENSQHNRSVADLLGWLIPLKEAIFLLQNSAATIGQAVEVWIELLHRTRGTPVFPFVEERSRTAIRLVFFSPTKTFFGPKNKSARTIQSTLPVGEHPQSKPPGTKPHSRANKPCAVLCRC